ncbi:MAG: VWA domain-containing protein [Roseibium sp.]
MPFATIEAKLTINAGFSAAQQASIKKAIEDSYDGSAIAKKMFDDWIAAGKTLTVDKTTDNNAYGYPGTGRIEINLDWLEGNTYINPTGKAVTDTLQTLILHEFVHAVLSKLDNYDEASGDYDGDTVEFSNTMYAQLGLDKQLSYIAYDSAGTLHTLNYEYTGGKTIDVAVSRDGNISVGNFPASNPLASTKDLLIGGGSANTLISGKGDDFLVGAGGNDTLKGDAGTDTAVYLSDKLEYDVRRNSDGSWTVDHVRGGKTDGKDTLENIEKISFKGGDVFDLKPKGLTYQADIAFVIDTTGSMGDDIDQVKTQSLEIINAVFGSGTQDGRIGIVGFKDTENGEPSSVLLPFTEQVEFGDRQTAITDAVNSISVSGGGDLPETSFDGLRLALDGSMGDWRPGAGSLRVILFTDAAAKDGALASVVTGLANKIGATVTSSRSETHDKIGLHSFSLSSRDDLTDDGFFDTSDPIGSAFPANLQIYTIKTGSTSVDFSELEAIAAATGGSTSTSSSSSELVEQLLEIINKPAGSLYQIYRFFNTETGAHFYTSSSEERDNIISTLPQFTFEGNSFDSDTPPSIGQAVYRFLNQDNGIHFYTASDSEKANIEATLPQFALEGVAYYASLDESGGGQALFRFFNSETGSHFYTTSVEERDDIISTLGHFNYEGVAYYVDLA